MNYNVNDKYIKFCFKSFCFISILLFSFAPWMALQSALTRLFSKLLYVVWFLNLFLIAMFGKFSRKKLLNCLFLFIMIFVFSVIGIVKTNISAYLSQFTNFVIPLGIATMFYSLNNFSLGKKDISKLLLFLFVCCFANCVYGIYTVFSFDGDFSQLYISNTDYQPYNYVRNGRLRAFGFLQSAVIFSNYLSIVFLCLLFSIKKRNFFFLRLFFIAFVFYALLLSGSRTNLYAIIVSLLLLLFFNRHRTFVFFFSVLSIALILVFVMITDGVDLSALGRIKQYADAGFLFIKKPWGYGIGYAGFPRGVVSFDCAILTIFVNLGVIGICYVLFLIFKAIQTSRDRKDNCGFVCDAIVLILFLLSGFVNVIHLGFLTLLIIIFTLIKMKGNIV